MNTPALLLIPCLAAHPLRILLTVDLLLTLQLERKIAAFERAEDTFLCICSTVGLGSLSLACHTHDVEPGELTQGSLIMSCLRLARHLTCSNMRFGCWESFCRVLAHITLN